MSMTLINHLLQSYGYLIAAALYAGSTHRLNIGLIALVAAVAAIAAA